MRFVHDDGGREAAGYRGTTGDCVTRSIAIATGLPYADVYAAMWDGERALKGRQATGPRRGVGRKVYEPFLLGLGWTWTPTMRVGQGCAVHLREEELPAGRLIVRVSKHVTAVIDGVIHDNHDCQRDGTRCVYGYFSKAP